MGVTVRFIAELKAAGIAQLPIESLIRLQTHSVTPAMIKELGDLGYKTLSADQLSHLASHGVAVEAGPLVRAGAKGRGRSVYFRDPDGSLLEFISYG